MKATRLIKGNIQRNTELKLKVKDVLVHNIQPGWPAATNNTGVRKLDIYWRRVYTL